MNGEQEYEAKYIAEGPKGALSVLEQFATSKDGIEKFSALVVHAVREGEEKALKVAVLMKTLELIKEQVGEALREYYVKEAYTFGEKPFTYSGATIQVSENGGRYDYSACNHQGWNDLQKIIDDAKRQQGDIEAMLKTLKAPQRIQIDDELAEVKPPVKVGGKMGLKISIK